ncbi:MULTISPECIES: PIN domain-containing protein [unclassified Synechococcus]|uniref:PIN domain-containing protein n=1 Tax=unclassified Synechococcus TaxID=2626047 RepID=UPI000069946C|nr:MULTISPECIES: PIN domain-containing protein [unclassified Synechococcus]EAQ75973.1 hypothetical protein WH5701_14241 [Synechococcus sp. WH 5701]WFN58703.1 PIN domain-containing protein [Synechococcus sp. CCFWC 502]
MLLLDTNILIDVLRGEKASLEWLDQQQRPAISEITWIEVLVGCNVRDFPSTLENVLHPYAL